ncbi:MAG TPA: hypothetical protein VJ596_00265 [Gemmatimonadaceae bacterium]|nr:hypothetical protein [Gemmatimonadaceae bacterium]
MLSVLIGREERLPESVLARYPELAHARFRRGGLPLRVGGWALGQSSVAAITLWRTIFLAPCTHLEPELLLHELRHVHQFQASLSFPIRYLWESLRRGYRQNRFELDARSFARERLREEPSDIRRGEG